MNLRSKLLWMTAIFALLLCGCATSPLATREQSTTSLRLLDVTTGYGRARESYWRVVPAKINIRCFSEKDENGLTATLLSCAEFPNPPQLPSSAELLAINHGRAQRTISVWNVSEEMFYCEHNSEGALSSRIGSARFCEPFTYVLMGKGTSLISLNSGTSTKAQSFWTTPDLSVVVCDHEKISTGAFGLGADKFGPITSCNRMIRPDVADFRSDLSYKLAGATSDYGLPFESFWQNDEGHVMRCKHTRVGDWSLGIGPVEYCTNIFVPQVR